MAVPTYTKTGNKATAPAKLDKAVFNCQTTNHELVHKAYLAYLANGRKNLAITKKRGQVSGGGKKPWRQKGTGRARFGSSRNPIWRGGGVAFGPSGNENYTINISTSAKKQALRQALTMASEADKISVIESFEPKAGSTKSSFGLLTKLGHTKNVLLIVAEKDKLLERSISNLAAVNVVQANYLNVYDILNADQLIITAPSLSLISQWLAPAKKAVAVPAGVKDE